MKELNVWTVLQSEVAELESTLKTAPRGGTVYLVPDATALCTQLHPIRRLMASEKFVIIIPIQGTISSDLSFFHIVTWFTFPSPFLQTYVSCSYHITACFRLFFYWSNSMFTNVIRKRMCHLQLIILKPRPVVFFWLSFFPVLGNGNTFFSAFASHMFPALGTGYMFPALGTGYRFPAVTCFH